MKVADYKSIEKHILENIYHELNTSIYILIDQKDKLDDHGKEALKRIEKVLLCRNYGIN